MSGRGVLAASAVLVVVSMWGAAVAGAHGDAGALEVVDTEVVVRDDGLHELQMTVAVRFPDDGHPALVADVEVTGRAEGGVTLLPVRLAPTEEDGIYVGTIEVSDGVGVWDLVMRSTEPDAQMPFSYDPATRELTGLIQAEEDGGGLGTGTRLALIAAGCSIVTVVAWGARVRRRRAPAR